MSEYTEQIQSKHVIVDRDFSADKKRQAFDYDVDGNLKYMGVAEPGTLTSQAKWRISRLTYNGSAKLTDILWSDGNNNEDNVWDNRASLNYL